MADFKLLAGLGNPGDQYAETRHNLGFMLLDELCRQAAAQPHWQTRFEAQLARLTFAGAERWLVKPLTFMNLSGRAVRQVMSFFRVAPEEIVVVHDDVDLAFGTLRLMQACGDGGHKGVRSITAELGTSDYVRLRCGVGRPEAAAGQPEAAARGVADWVLDGFSPEEEGALDGFMKKGVLALETLCLDGLSRAQNKFNREV